MQALCENDAKRRVLVDVLLHYIKDQAPPLDEMSFDLPTPDRLQFEHLTGLFASTTFDESIITMNIRQAGYLFGLIRQTQPDRVIQVGRHWGGTTFLIAAALSGRGKFWSFNDRRLLDAYLDQRGIELSRPIEARLADLCERLQLSVEIVAGDPQASDVETGDVDLVFLDGDPTYEGAKRDFERFGTRVRIGGTVLLNDAVHDAFFDPWHTEGVRYLFADLLQRPDFRLVRSVRRMAHFERTQ